MMRKLECPVVDGKIVSPCVGRFYRLYDTFGQNGYAVVGTVRRLEEKIVLVVPETAAPDTIVAANGAFVMTGEILATCATDDVKENVGEDVVRLCSPQDGFICLTDGSGEPLKCSGDILHRNDVIAVLEFMKIRMEIEFDGVDGSVFEGYLCADRVAVRRGEPICIYRKRAVCPKA